MLTRIQSFFQDIYAKRAIIGELAKRDFQQQYMGSYLGFIWVFLQPLLFIIILYIVFTFGFRSGASTDMPFVVYLISGMIGWMYFASILNISTSIISSSSFLVNKVDFRLSILPIVKILSDLIPHFFFILLAILIAWINGYAPSFYTLQIFYYLFCMITLLLGFSWMTSSTNLFVKDVGQIVSIITQFGFWMTPIFWNINSIPPQYQWLVKLNPMCYVVLGYRDSLVYKIGFWHHPYLTLYFWGFSGFVLLLGITIFGKLRPHFAEVI